MAALFLLGHVAAWAIKKDRKYLDIARKSMIVPGLLVVAFAVLYIFERVVLM